MLPSRAADDTDAWCCSTGQFKTGRQPDSEDLPSTRFLTSWFDRIEIWQWQLSGTCVGVGNGYNWARFGPTAIGPIADCPHLIWSADKADVPTRGSETPAIAPLMVYHFIPVLCPLRDRKYRRRRGQVFF